MSRLSGYRFAGKDIRYSMTPARGSGQASARSRASSRLRIGVALQISARSAATGRNRVPGLASDLEAAEPVQLRGTFLPRADDHLAVPEIGNDALLHPPLALGTGHVACCH